MPPRPTTGQFAAVAVGNALAFYDFLTFAFFATQIGQAFFPSHDSGIRLLLTLATFGAGFLTRPLGGALIGAFADRHGRKPAMLLSFALMGAAIIGLALTPSYNRIGLAAPLLALAFRLAQGFALGGEVGPSTAFLMEASPPARRGFYISLQFATQNGAVLSAGLIGLLLSNVMAATAMADWGWRVAFLLGALVVPLGLILRRRLPETLETAAASPTLPSARGMIWLGLLGVVLLAADTISTYTMNYMTTFGINTLGIPAGKAFGATVATGLCGMICNPIGGMLADRFGRKPVLMIFFLALLAATLPSFWAMSMWRSPLALIAGSALMAGLLGLGVPSILASLSESLAPHRRAGGLGLIYALGISVFGGTTQFIVTWLIRETGSALAPAWYMSAALIVGIIAMAKMRETAPGKLTINAGA